jgi:hypothetical protein
MVGINVTVNTPNKAPRYPPDTFNGAIQDEVFGRRRGADRRSRAASRPSHQAIS